DPVGALQGAHARVQVLVVEAAPAAGGEKVGQAPPEDGAGEPTDRLVDVLAGRVLAVAGPAGEEWEEGVPGGVASLLEHAGGGVGTHLLGERPAQRGEGGDGERQLRG